MICTFAHAIKETLDRYGLHDVWWGSRILGAWPHAVGQRVARKARPFLEKCDLEQRGLLTVAVPSSAWMQELSFLNIADRINRELGGTVVRKVRFEVRKELP